VYDQKVIVSVLIALFIWDKLVSPRVPQF